MTAAVAVMAATTPTPSLPKRHGFSIESLIGKPDSPPPSPQPPNATQQQEQQQQQFHPHINIHHHHNPLQQITASSIAAPTSPIASVTKSIPTSLLSINTPPHSRPLPLKPHPKDLQSKGDRDNNNKHHIDSRDSISIISRESERDRVERESFMRREQEILMRERAENIRNFRDKETRAAREREIEMLREKEARERELVIESMRERERELRDIRELKEKAELARERELQQQQQQQHHQQHHHHHHPQHRRPESVDGSRNFTTPSSFSTVKNSSSSSPSHSHTPPSPMVEKCVSPPETENRLSAWGGEEFKHLLGGLHPGNLDSNGLYQPLRVCNRTLASMNSLGGSPGVPTAGHLAMGIGGPQFSPLSMNPFFPRDLPPHHTHPLLAARYPGFMHHRYPMGPPPGLLFHPYRKPKRNRTAFSPNQLLQLEQAFEKNHYVVGQERKSLAAKLQLTETQVKVWFQNRRTKHKRMKAEEDGGSSGSHLGDSGSDLMTYIDHDDEEHCTSDDEEEELSVTEDS